MRLLCLFIATLISISISAQSHSSSQKTLITKRTATWCPNCGTWGWDMAKAIEELNKSNAILIRAHYSGELESQAAIDITKNFNATYQPEFYINEVRQSVGSSSWASKVKDFEEQIDANSEKTSNASFVLSGTFLEDEITVDARIEFTSEGDGDYFLGTYLLEDEVVANQASLGSETIHNSVLRASFSEDSFGEQIGQGTIESGFKTSVTKSLKIEGDPIEDRKFRVLTILWKKDGELYRVENVHSATVSQYSSVIDVSNSVELLIRQSASDLIVGWTQKETISSSQLELHGVNGQKLHSEILNLHAGQNEFVIDINKWRNQIVLVSIKGGGSLIATEKVYLK